MTDQDLTVDDYVAAVRKGLPRDIALRAAHAIPGGLSQDEREELRQRLEAPLPVEPTTHVVVQHAADVPEAIRDHAMEHHGPGVSRHPRLGIWVIVLDELDPERLGRKLTEAWGELGLVREQLARNTDAGIALAEQRDQARAEADRLRAELHAVAAGPIAHLAEDGSVTVDWPEGARSCLVSRELFDELAGRLAEADPVPHDPDAPRLEGFDDHLCAAIIDGGASICVQPRGHRDGIGRATEVERLRNQREKALELARLGHHEASHWEHPLDVPAWVRHLLAALGAPDERCLCVPCSSADERRAQDRREAAQE